jgi:hypothetical protein
MNPDYSDQFGLSTDDYTFVAAEHAFDIIWSRNRLFLHASFSPAKNN